MITIEIDMVIRRAEEKQELVRQFLKLTEEQARAIDGEDYEAVLTVISQKQHVVERVNLLDLERPIYMGANGERLQALYAQIKRDLARAIDLDNQNIERIRTNQALIIQKIRENQKKKATHAQYRGQGMHMEGILVDKVQ